MFLIISAANLLENILHVQQLHVCKLPRPRQWKWCTL